MKRINRLFTLCIFLLLGWINYAQTDEGSHASRVARQIRIEQKLDAFLRQKRNYVFSEAESGVLKKKLEDAQTASETVDAKSLRENYRKYILTKRFFEEHPEYLEAYRVAVGTKTSRSLTDICTNGDFESDSLTGFEGYWHFGTNSTQCNQVPLDVPGSYTPVPMTGTDPRMLITDNVPDPTIPGLTQTYGGSAHAVRINRPGGNQDITVLRRPFVTTFGGTQVVSFNAAIVLESVHNNDDDPFMMFRILDNTGAVVGGPECITPTTPGIAFDTVVAGGRIYSWLDWRCYNVVFDGNVNSTYYFEIAVGDCGQSAHGGYVYADNICNKPCPPSDLGCCETLSGEVLSWSNVPGAVSYEIEFSWNDPNCCETTEFPSAIVVSVPTNSYVIPFDEVNCFSWKVRAVYGDGTKTDYSASECSCVEPIVCKVPENLDCKEISGGLTLSWGAVPGAYGYEVQLNYNDPDCCGGDSVVTTIELTPGTSLTVSDPDTCFSWSVRSICTATGDRSEWSDTICACNIDTSCVTPVNLDCQWINNSYFLSWGTVPGVSGYEVVVTYNDPACCDSGVVSTTTYPTTTSYIYLPGDSCFSWKVRSVCTTIDVSDWSDTLCVCTPDTGCETPVNLDCEWINNSYHLSWGSVVGASGYEIFLTYNDPACCSSGTVSTTTYTITATDIYLPGDSCFSWRVRAICSSSSVSDWSDTLCVCTPDTGCATPINVKCQANTAGNMFTWSTVPGATSYQFMIVINDPACCSSGTGSIGSGFTADTFRFVPASTGCFSFKVRSICGTETSAWSTVVCSCYGSSSIHTSVVPNPSQDYVTITVSQEGTAGENGELKLTITEMSGTELYRNDIRLNEAEKVDVRDFPNGMYLYRIADSDGRTIDSGKMVIQK